LSLSDLQSPFFLIFPFGNRPCICLFRKDRK
jgi:hypothetical protein